MSHAPLRRILPLAGLALLVTAGLIYLASISGRRDGPLQASGTVAAVEVAVAPEVAGRVAEVLVEQGQAVRAGAVLYRLDDSLLQAQRQRALAAQQAAAAALEAAAAQAEMARLQYELALDGARAQEAAARQTVWARLPAGGAAAPPWYFERGEQSAAAQAEVEAAQRGLESARAELVRAVQAAGAGPAERELLAAQAAWVVAEDALARAQRAREPQDVVDLAEALRDQAAEALEDAERAFDQALEGEAGEALRAARAAVAVAQARLDAALDRRAALRTGAHALPVAAAEAALRLAEAAQAQAEAAAAQARAELRLLDLQAERLVVRAPIDGVVLVRSLEPGEVVLAGGVGLTIGLLDQLTITVYLPEDRYGEVRLGDIAQVRTDSFPDRAFGARVTRIADRAEFTPRNVQTAEGRRTTVFAVELAVEDPDGLLRPGMPADVSFGAE